MRRIFPCTARVGGRLCAAPAAVANRAALLASVRMASISTASSENDERLSKDAPPASQRHEAHSLNPFEKTFLAVGAAVAGFLDPTRQDMIAALGETTGEPALRYMLGKMKADPVGQQLLRAQPTVSSQTVDMAWLASLPENTFGRAYLRFLSVENVTPDSRTRVKYITDPELAYVIRRYRESHDYYHALLNVPTTVQGELILKYFELAQTGLPSTALASLVGPLRLSIKEQGEMIANYAPRAFLMGLRAKPLINVWFEKEFERDLRDLRQSLHVEPLFL